MLLLLLLGLLVKVDAYAVVTGEFEDRQLDQDNVEAVARIMLADRPYKLVNKEYKGTTLNVEVRSKDNKKPIWTATVLFRPSGNGILNFNTLNLVDAKVEIAICARDGYFGEDNSYLGEEEDSFPKGRDGPLLISCEPLKGKNQKTHMKENFHKDIILETSLFEFVLPKVMTIKSLIELVEDTMKLPNSTRAIQYTGSGYSSYIAQNVRGSSAHNCATFACTLLERMEVPLSENSDYLKHYITHVSQTNKTRIGVVLGGGIVGAAFYTGALVSGPFGWGALAVGLVGGGALGWYSDARMSAAYPGYVYNELYRIRDKLSKIGDDGRPSMRLVLLDGRDETSDHYRNRKNYEKINYPNIYTDMKDDAETYSG